MITRRRVVIALGASALSPFASFAQPGKVWRVGFLVQRHMDFVDADYIYGPFTQGMRELGYVVGKNLVIEWFSAEAKSERLPELAAELVRLNVDVLATAGTPASLAAQKATTIPIVMIGVGRWADGKFDRLPDLAAELVRLKVDAIVTVGTPGARAAKQATTTIPIVFAAVGDAVAVGLVASLARPGGNVTGSTFFQPQLIAKRLELLKDANPRITQIAWLFNPDNPGAMQARGNMEAAAKLLKVGLQQFGARGPLEFESAFSAMANKRIDALVIGDDSELVGNAKAIAEFAAKQRLPSAGGSVFAEAGGMIDYGVNGDDMYRRAAHFVDKVLKGAKPGDIPVEQATVFELVINMKAATALGVKIPNSVLVRATKVIE